jgi:hypothetical protein
MPQHKSWAQRDTYSVGTGMVCQEAEAKNFVTQGLSAKISSFYRF